MEEIIEYEFCDRFITINRNKVVKLQALWRGHVVRKKMKQLQEVYSSLYKELEETSLHHLYWKPVCIKKPQFLREEEYYKRLKEDQDNQEKQQDSNALAAKNRPQYSDTTTAQRDIAIQIESQIKQELNPKYQGPESSIRDNANALTGNSKIASASTDNQIAHSSSTINNIQDKNQEYVVSVNNEKEGDSDLLKVNHRQTETSVDRHEEPVRDITAQPQNTTHPTSVTDKVESTPHISSPAADNVTRMSDIQAQTSYWDTHSSDTSKDQHLKSLNKEELKQHRSAVAMELLWLQQALESRKQYLRLKSQMTN